MEEYKYIGNITDLDMEGIECEVETENGPQLINIPISNILTEEGTNIIYNKPTIAIGDTVEIIVKIKHLTTHST